MNYLDRLIQRAREVPSGDRAQLHDPFEQVAEWPLDPPKARQSDGPPSAEPPPARRVPAAAEIPGVVPKPIEVPEPPAALPPQPEPARAEAPAGPVPDEPLAPPKRSDSLEIADAFMRSLVAAPVEPSAERRPETILPSDPPVARAERTVAAPAEPARMTPSKPIEPARSVPTPEPLPPGAKGGPPPVAQRTPPPAPPIISGRRLIIQRSGDDRLADLARGSNIVRFGIRQG